MTAPPPDAIAPLTADKLDAIAAKAWDATAVPDSAVEFAQLYATLAAHERRLTALERPAPRDAGARVPLHLVDGRPTWTRLPTQWNGREQWTLRGDGDEGNDGVVFWADRGWASFHAEGACPLFGDDLAAAMHDAETLLGVMGAIRPPEALPAAEAALESTDPLAALAAAFEESTRCSTAVRDASWREIMRRVKEEVDPPEGYYVEPHELQPAWWRWGRRDRNVHRPPGTPLELSRETAVAACWEHKRAESAPSPPAPTTAAGVADGGERAEVPPEVERLKTTLVRLRNAAYKLLPRPYPNMGFGGGSAVEHEAQRVWEAEYGAGPERVKLSRDACDKLFFELANLPADVNERGAEIVRAQRSLPVTRHSVLGTLHAEVRRVTYERDALRGFVEGVRGKLTATPAHCACEAIGRDLNALDAVHAHAASTRAPEAAASGEGPRLDVRAGDTWKHTDGTVVAIERVEGEGGAVFVRRERDGSRFSSKMRAHPENWALVSRAEPGEPPWDGERCKAPRCNGRRNCVGFRVDDDTWAVVVPEALRGRVVCLECFDEMAQSAGVAYEVRETFPVTWSTGKAPAQPPPERGEVDLARELYEQHPGPNSLPLWSSLTDATRKHWRTFAARVSKIATADSTAEIARLTAAVEAARGECERLKDVARQECRKAGLEQCARDKLREAVRLALGHDIAHTPLPDDDALVLELSRAARDGALVEALQAERDTIRTALATVTRERNDVRRELEARDAIGVKP